jgi:putative transposase
MKRQKFSESQILKILKEFESGLSVQELGRKYGFYPSTLYDWRKKYADITG